MLSGVTYNMIENFTECVCLQTLHAAVIDLTRTLLDPFSTSAIPWGRESAKGKPTTITITTVSIFESQTANMLNLCPISIWSI